MEPVADLYCLRMRIRCCWRISGCPISGYDLDVWKCCEPSADICSLSGRDHVDYPMALKVDHNRTIREPFPKCKIIHADPFYRSFIHNGRHFFSRPQMLLLHAMIFSFFKSLEAFKELRCVEVWTMFLTSRSVFFAFGAAKGCFSANVLCGQSRL